MTWTTTAPATTATALRVTTITPAADTVACLYAPTVMTWAASNRSNCQTPMLELLVTEKGTPMRCEMEITVYEDAQGHDLCESLDLPEYPHYQCPSVALDGIEMCHDHRAFASHWDKY